MVFENSKTYDRIKWFSLVAAPLIVTFLTAIVDIWSIPYGEKIVMTVAALSALLGGLVTKSAKDYQKKLETEAESKTE